MNARHHSKKWYCHHLKPIIKTKTKELTLTIKVTSLSYQPKNITEQIRDKSWSEGAKPKSLNPKIHMHLSMPLNENIGLQHQNPYPKNISIHHYNVELKYL